MLVLLTALLFASAAENTRRHYKGEREGLHPHLFFIYYLWVLSIGVGTALLVSWRIPPATAAGYAAAFVVAFAGVLVWRLRWRWRRR